MKILNNESNKLVHDYLTKKAIELFEKRKNEVSNSFNIENGLIAYQEKLKLKYKELIGELPIKTPLNAKVLGIIERDGYKIEKISYESRPNFHVTANFYIPTRVNGLVPGILYFGGHSTMGKFGCQEPCVMLVKNGFGVLITDPIGQGERRQFLTPLDKPAIDNGVTVHTLQNIGALLVGSSAAAQILWDNIRSLDYLISRPEIDKEKIGCSGTSGGGAQTTFLMSYDDRIGPAAPSCHIRTFESMFLSESQKGGWINTDGCQILSSEVFAGMDKVDYITMRAPKPTLILAAEQDHHNIDSTSKAYREAKRFYSSLGHTRALDFFASDSGHGLDRTQCAMMVQWMKKWLLQDDTKAIVTKIEWLEDEELQVTQTGNVLSNWENEISIWDIIKSNMDQLVHQRKKFRKDHCDNEFLNKIKELTGTIVIDEKPVVEYVGMIEEKGYTIEKLIIRQSDRVPVPGLFFIPEALNDLLEPILYLNNKGKEIDAKTDGPIEKLLKEGRIVLAIDYCGCGETADFFSSSFDKFLNSEYRIAMEALQVGQPILGLRVGDVLAAIEILLLREEVKLKKADIVAVENAGPIALHAAAFDDRINNITLKNSISSFLDILTFPILREQIGNAIPNALKFYDLPDLVEVIKPRKVLFTKTI